MRSVGVVSRSATAAAPAAAAPPVPRRSAVAWGRGPRQKCSYSMDGKWPSKQNQSVVCYVFFRQVEKKIFETLHPVENGKYKFYLRPIAYNQQFPCKNS